MAGESNADVYASFGVSPGAVTSSNVEDHEQAMLALDVAARDGDDAIVLVDNDDPYGNDDKFATEVDESFVQVRISSDGDDTAPDLDITNNGSEVTDGDDVITTDGEDFAQLGDAPDELTSSSNELGAHETGFQEMVDQAGERGLSEETIERIQAEYQGDGISEQSFEELAKAGYSKSFVESYIRGQEALVTRYVDEVKAYAGGAEKFDAVLQHLETTNSEAAESLMEALEARNLGSVKAILNLAAASYNAKFGKKSTRTMTTKASPTPEVKQKVEGFESQAEMIKAMSDPRYRTDSKYRREVEQKVMRSEF